MDRFHHEPDPARKNGWRVVRVTDSGQRIVTPGKFNKEHKARSHAYALEVAQERHRNRPIYVGD
jgi:hypothetical protein